MVICGKIRVCLRPYMVSWKRQCGNKGYVLMEQFRNLLRLILAKGFETNNEIAGVELPVCSVHNPKLIDGITMWMQAIEDSLPANSISMIKGWSRVVIYGIMIWVIKLYRPNPALPNPGIMVYVKEIMPKRWIITIWKTYKKPGKITIFNG